MLFNLHVKNLAIIDEVEVDFSDGFNVLTGETGAGKSIIIGSVNLALGGKAGKDIIRTGADSALVELSFSIDQPAQKEALEALGIPLEEDQILISRKLMPKRSICRINGETVSRDMLQRVADTLIDIHGQNEQQSLLHTAKHMEILDRYAEEAIGDRLEYYEKIYGEYRWMQSELSEKQIPEEERLREISFLQYELEEIRNAALKDGEEEALEEEYQRLSHASAIVEALSRVYHLSSSGEMSASEQLGEGLQSLSKVAEYDGRIQAFAEQLSELDSLLTDFNRDIAAFMDDFNQDPEALAGTEKRLDQIRSIKMKYGATVEQVMEYEEKQLEKLVQYQGYEQYRETLEKRMEKREEVLQELAGELTEIRQAAAKKLAKEITEALIDLNFLQVQFAIEVRPVDTYTARGMDEIEFMISTNPGEPLRSIGAAASGGELSRIMLAVKAVLAEHDEISTLIFDEIDVGISGRTAQKVAEKMALIGKNHQVICISHLAQIAAMADAHYLIEKKNEQDRTATEIFRLEEQDSAQELARILGGAKITDAVRKSAEEMKELALAEKKRIRSH